MGVKDAREEQVMVIKAGDEEGLNESFSCRYEKKKDGSFNF